VNAVSRPATYLDAIVAWHRKRAEADDRDVDVLRADAVAARLTDARSMETALRAPGLSVIAEIKRRSPSKGALNADLHAGTVAAAYRSGGAACLSVLTDGPHFGGSSEDLASARAAVDIPVLRKDFTVCEADVYDAALMGADAVLLIVAALNDGELAQFHRAADDVGLAVLVETHDEAEVERALMIGARIVGVNQRDLQTFQVDTERAVRVSKVIPDSVLRVAESGVRGREDAAVLFAAGFDAVLVGESVVTSGDPGEAVRAIRSAGG
jgi:indole-3-glycerol phosphate synthase